MNFDPDYAKLPEGPRRMDALFARAKELGGSDAGAIEILGSLAASEGFKQNHPFNTGLTEDGVLARHDKADHFFAHAMWTYQDHWRLIPIAESNGLVWEVLGEIKHWFGGGDGFDQNDIWANRLGREFGQRIYRNRNQPDATVVPSEIIQQADQFMPEDAGPESEHTGSK